MATSREPLGPLGEFQGFVGLRHKAIIRRYDQNGNIGKICSSFPDLGKGGMTRRIDKGDLLITVIDLVGSHVFG